MGQNTDDSSGIKKYGFPRHLLEANDEEKKIYFENIIVEHKFLKEAIEKTLRHITTHVSERLIFICGPSGIGKKAFINILKDRIFEIYNPIRSNNPGVIPFVDVEAMAPEQGSFNFRMLWKMILTKLQEPMLEAKISYRVDNGYDLNGKPILISRAQKAEYQEVLQNTLKYRDVKALLINEAQHLLRVSGGKKANESVEQLKSLVNGSQTPVILVGTYELTTYLDDLSNVVTDQINQRARIIHFPCYHQNIKSEVIEFGKAAKLLLRSMPLEQTPEMLVDDDWKYFYQYSLGCIGVLKIWFMDAFSFALSLGATTLTKEHLEETRISGQRCSFMLQRIIEGENKMIKILSDGDISARLGFNEVDSGKPESENHKQGYNRKPFERNPKRDKVDVG